MPSKHEYFSILTDPSGVEFVRCGDEVLIVPLTAEGDVLLTIEPSAAYLRLPFSR